MINRYRFKLRLFLSFLKEHGCYEKYKENYYDIEKRFPKYHKGLSFEELFYSNPYNIIELAFIWELTDEDMLIRKRLKMSLMSMVNLQLVLVLDG